MREFFVTLPYILEIGKTKKRRWSININQYRNTHYMTLNTLKRKYEEEVGHMIPNLSFKKAEITLTFYHKRDSDLDNTLAIQCKFFQDLLVHKGVLEDDNFNIVPRVVLLHGGKSETDAPYVTAIVKEIE